MKSLFPFPALWIFSTPFIKSLFLLRFLRQYACLESYPNFTEKAAGWCFWPFSKGRYMSQKRDYFTATLTKYLGVVCESLWEAVSFFVENIELAIRPSCCP